MTEIVTPFAQFFDTSGAPLNNGAIFIGTVNLDAQTNPLPVYWDEALTIPAAQPIRTLNGYAVRNGTPARIFCNAASFSMTVQTGTGRTVWAVRDATSKDTSSGIVSVKNYNAIGDGITNDRFAIEEAFAANTEVYFPAGIYLVTSNLIIPAGKVVSMNAAAAFSVPAGVTLTIYAQFNGNPDSHHFHGAGSVIGIGEVYPEWFGAVGNGTTDDAPAFQKTIPCVKASLPAASNGVVRLQAKLYMLNSSWVVEQTALAGVDIIGTGTLIGDSRLLGGPGFTGALVNIQGNTDPIQSIVDFKLSGFALISQNVGQGQGLVFNTIGNNRINGLQKSSVENIHIDGFKQGIFLRNSRLLKFSRVSVWNNRIDGTLFANANWCLIIVDGSVGEFDVCADFTFENCNFVTNKQFYSKIIQINAQSPNSATAPPGKYIISVAGIRFTECIFYNGGNFSIQLTASNYAQMADIWFTNCQLDDTTGVKIDITSANALITDINYQGNYHTRVEGNCVRLDASAANGRINSINIANNYCAGVVNAAAVDATGIDGINVVGNRWSGVDWAVGAAMNFLNCNHIVCSNNNMGRAGRFLAGTFNNIVALQGTGNYYVVTGNNSAGLATGVLINNTTGAANTAIANNI